MMKRTFTSVALSTVFGLSMVMAQNGQFSEKFRTLPTETGQGVITTLNYYNGGDNYIGYGGSGGYGSTNGLKTFVRMGSCWTPNGRVWLECVDADQDLYILSGQGHYLADFQETSDTTGVGIVSPVQGDTEKLLKFKVVEQLNDDGSLKGYSFIYTHNGEDYYMQAFDNATNAINFLKVEGKDPLDGQIKDLADVGYWLVGSWGDVGATSIDGMSQCADGYYYDLITFPYDIIIPIKNDAGEWAFPQDSTKVPGMGNVDKFQQGWIIRDADGGGFVLENVKRGDMVPAGAVMLARSSGSAMDFLISPDADYVTTVPEDGKAVGYYGKPMDAGEVFMLNLSDGYPKISLTEVTYDKMYDGNFEYEGYGKDVTVKNPENNVVNEGGAFASMPFNRAYIIANRSTTMGGVTEYRLDEENLTLVGYEDRDYSFIAKNELTGYLTGDNLDVAFYMASADTARLNALLNEFIAAGDKTEEDYEELKQAFIDGAYYPASTVKGVKTVGTDRFVMGDQYGFRTDGQWAWDCCNAIVYFEKVEGTVNQYYVATNGEWLGDPANVNEDGTFKFDQERYAYTIIVTAPGQFIISYTDAEGNEMALVDQDNRFKTGNLKDVNGAYNSKAKLKLDLGISTTMQFMHKSVAVVPDADGTVYYYNTVCVPYALTTWSGTDNKKEELLEVLYDANGKIYFKSVKVLAPGVPGIIRSTGNSKNIVGIDETQGYVTEPKNGGNNVLIGTFIQTPSYTDNPNMLVLGAINDTIYDENDEMIINTHLALVPGNVNDRYFPSDNGGSHGTNHAYFLNPNFVEGADDKDNSILLPTSDEYVIDDTDWHTVAQINFADAFTNLVGQPFGIVQDADIIDMFKKKVDEVQTEADYNALSDEMAQYVIQPDTMITVVKNGAGALIYDAGGVKADYEWYWDSPSSRTYLEKVEDFKYMIAVNGKFFADPATVAVGAAAPMTTDKAAAYVFTIKFDRPGTFYITDASGKLALIRDTDNLVKVANLKNDKGAVNEAADWTMDHGRPKVQFSTRGGSMAIDGTTYYFTDICLPYAVTTLKDADNNATLIELLYDEEDNMYMKEVEILPAGTPGIIRATGNFPQVGIYGYDWVTEPVQDEKNVLTGTFADVPATGAVENMHIVNVITNDIIDDETGDLVSVGSLALMLGEVNTSGYSNGRGTAYGVNRAYYAGGANAEDIILDDVYAGRLTGVKEVIVVNKQVLNNDFIYNLQGQRVTENYKGIVIKNGMKYIQK